MLDSEQGIHIVYLKNTYTSPWVVGFRIGKSIICYFDGLYKDKWHIHDNLSD